MPVSNQLFPLLDTFEDDDDPLRYNIILNFHKF